MLIDLIKKNRSYRRFYQSENISYDTLKQLIELARFSASGRNAQPLKYYLTNSDKDNEKVFETLAWAGFLKDWDGPVEGEKPSAYIVICGDRKIASNFYVDHGIAAQSILLGATEKGLGGCIFASVKREKLKENFNLPEHLDVLLVIAIGKPKEEVILEEMKEDNFKYWRDEQQVHHVPKRKQEDLIINYK